MTMPLHDILIGPAELTRTKAGEVVELMTDKQMMVALVLEKHYDQTPLRNGSELIPVTPRDDPVHRGRGAHQLDPRAQSVHLRHRPGGLTATVAPGPVPGARGGRRAAVTKDPTTEGT